MGNTSPFEFDLNVVAERVGLDAEDLLELFAVFFPATGENMATIENAHATGDSAVTARAAHTIKGASATLGLMEISAIAGQIETAARDGQMGNVLPLLHDLRPIVDAVHHAFRQRFPGRIS